jgi:hypothetical protein
VIFEKVIKILPMAGWLLKVVWLDALLFIEGISSWVFSFYYNSFLAVDKNSLS